MVPKVTPTQKYCPTSSVESGSLMAGVSLSAVNSFHHLIHRFPLLTVQKVSGILYDYNFIQLSVG